MSDQHSTRIHSLKNSYITAATLLLAIFAAMGAVLGMDIDALASSPVLIGVLAHKGTDICREMWQPTMDYLDKALPGRHFDIVPLPFDDIESAVKSKSIDFLICNPAIYVDLEVRYGITRTMTLRNLVGKQIVSEYGGVIFCRAERRDLQGLRDARGQRLAATEQTSFGGWYMVLREFKSVGVDPERDCARLFFLDNHPAVVRAVLSGEADIGTVRTDTIERMAANSEIRMDEIRVIPSDVVPGLRTTFPYLHSTRLYPEWPFTRLSGTNEDLSREVTVALLSMPADSTAAIAAHSGGWGICLDYTSVHECLRELRMPPYEHYGQMSWLDMWRQYWQWLGAITALIIALLGALLHIRSRNLALTMVSGQNRLLLTSAGEGICAIDMNGITTFVNPTANKILGYTTEELIGKNLHALTHHTKQDGQPYPSHECPGHKTCSDGTVHQGIDEFFYCKDGSIIPVSYSSRPLVDGGRICGAVICFQDYSERKLAEEVLKQSEQRFRIVARLSFDFAYSCHNIDGGYIVDWITDTFYVLTGISEAELKEYRCWLVLTHPEDRDKATEPLFRLLPGDCDTREFRIVAKDGRILTVINHMECEADPAVPGGLRIYGSVHDITERKKAEAEQRESEEKFSKAFKKAPMLMSISSLEEGTYIDVNEEFTKVSGFEREEAIGKTSVELGWLKAKDRELLIQDLKKKGSIEGRELELETKDKRKSFCLYYGEVINIGGRQRLLSIAQDITEHKLAEVEKAKLEFQLKQAQKMETIGSLAGGIAHDLNNILFPITGLSEMLLDDIPPDTPEHGSIEQIYKSAQRGSDLVKQILAFSRQSNPQKLPIRIQPILKEVLNLSRATIPMNIEITSNINKDCGMISADPTQVHQVAMNLITNAYHAVEGSSGMIHIGLKETEFEKYEMPCNLIQPGRYACITVYDTGVGMDKTLIDKIFDPYFTTKEMGKGTGLGLSVVHGIVKEHGGDIRIYSEIGKGTTFNVYLPLLEDVKDKKDAAITRKYPTGCERILLVDDEEPIAYMVKIMLERLGYQVTVRTSSQDALDAFKANPLKFDIVISDRGMPNMTGEQLARELISIRPGIPIILCTGFSDENDEHHAKSIGVKGFLKKPVATGDLAETVRKVLDNVTV